MDTREVFQGIDIGGTKIGLCIGDESGQILRRAELPNDGSSASSLLDAAMVRLDELGRECGATEPTALGVACPGPVCPREGKFHDPPNLPSWHNFEVRSYLQQRRTIPVAIMNDANAGVLAESYWGAAAAANTAVFLTMSTGFGAGLLLDGRVFEGSTGLAGEVGHVGLSDDGPVGFARRGSAEGYLSGPGMVQVARAEALIARQAGVATALHDHPDLTAKKLCQIATNGDAVARRAIGRCAHQLGRLCSLLTDLFNPDVIILGTIGKAYPDLFIPDALQVVREEAIRRSAEHLQIVPSPLTQRGDQSALAIARLGRSRTPAP